MTPALAGWSGGVWTISLISTSVPSDFRVHTLGWVRFERVEDDVIIE